MIREWIDRFSHPTPAFFNKVARLGKISMAAGGSILVPTVLPGIHVVIPPTLIEIASHLMVAGGAMVAVAKAAKED